MSSRPRIPRPGSGAVAPPPVGVAPQDIFRVAAFGDSLMWGQGLKRDETFAALITRGLGVEHQTTPSLVVNRARSGAVLMERGMQRADFLDTFPALFTSRPARQRFRDGDDGRAVELYGEIPASFPTVQWQVDILSAEEGKRIDVVLLSGGANDIGFDSVINPQEFPGAFIQEWDGKIRSIAHDDLLAQIRRTRAKCPNAVILVFGYYAPLSYASHKSKIRAFFKHEADDDFGWWINRWIQVVDIEQMIVEARIRSVWAQSRAQHWMRQAVTDANRTDEVRGPGVLFVPSGMAGDNSVFANNPELHRDYTHPTSDDAQQRRQDGCPRFPQLSALRGMSIALSTTSAVSKARLRSLRDDIDGPASLIAVLNALSDNPSDTRDRAEALRLIDKEISRIQRALIASFLHPDAAGARRYADNALKRYREHRKLSETIKKNQRPGQQTGLAVGGPETLEGKLTRYGMRSAGTLHADIGHLDVDAFSLQVVTQRDSDAHLAPDIFLVVATRDESGSTGERRYQLNFPYRIVPLPGGNLVIIKKFYPHFEPAETNRFTIDTGNTLRLDHITGIKVAMSPDELTGTVRQDSYGTVWRPRRINLEINGVQVLDRTFRGREVRPGGELPLDYPPPRPRGQVVAPVRLGSPGQRVAPGN